MPTKTDDLTSQQLLAADLLATGATKSDTAKATGVTRQTVSEWFNNDFVFRAEVNRRRNELWEEHTKPFRSFVPKALDGLEDELKGKRKLDAIIFILRANGLDDLKLPRKDETDPEMIEAEDENSKELKKLRRSLLSFKC